MIALKTITNPAHRRREAQQKTRSAQLESSHLPTQADLADLIQIKQEKSRTNRERHSMFFFIGLAITLGLLNVLFNWNFRKEQAILDLNVHDQATFEEVQDIPLTVQPPPPPPKIIQAPRIVEVPDEVILEEVEVAIDVETTEEMSVEEVVYEVPLEEEVAEEIFYFSETAPEPVGGIKSFYNFISENLKYPNKARASNIKGRVFIQFVVDKDGSLTDLKLLKGIGYGCDEEAMRVIAMAPKWNPGKQRGKPVKVYMTIPIVFELK